MSSRPPIACEECGMAFEPRSSRQRFCKATCRVNVNRRPSKRGRHAESRDAGQPLAVHTVGALVAATAAELQALGQLTSVAGRAALAIAVRIESPMETGSAVASMSKELSALMDRARAAAAPDQHDGMSPLEESTRAKLHVVR